MFALHAFLPSQNLRYIAPVEPMLRILAAAFLTGPRVLGSSGPRSGPTPEHPGDRGPEDPSSHVPWPWLGAGLLVNAVIEWMLFYTIFIRGQVYDPVTDHLLRALKMLPR
jgi:hypothetical protein